MINKTYVNLYMVQSGTRCVFLDVVAKQSWSHKHNLSDVYYSTEYIVFKKIKYNDDDPIGSKHVAIFNNKLMCLTENL